MKRVCSFGVQRIKLLVFIITLGEILHISTGALIAQNNGIIRKVVIDAGHGGKDPGAVGKRSQEKNITLSIALQTGEYIKKAFPEIEVVYTRKTNVFVPLHKRAQIANDNKADLFISVHCNASPSSRIYGTETYVMGLHKSQENLEVARSENASILQEENYSDHYEGFNPNSPEAHIIFSLYQNAYLHQSLDMASRVQEQFEYRVGLKNRGVFQAGFWVLYKTTMPGILIETGYLSNTKDEAYLLSEQGQEYIASAIYRAFKEYKIAYETEKPVKTVIAQTLKAPPPQSTPPIIYRVQIASSKKALEKNADIFHNLTDIFQYKHNDLYKYCTGKENSFEKANILKEELRRSYFKDAFVVAFKDGIRIPLTKARNLNKK